ncbi:MAG: endonuclease/exonuclease/phosphatase family protein [Myxococcota bacterium]
MTKIGLKISGGLLLRLSIASGIMFVACGQDDSVESQNLASTPTELQMITSNASGIQNNAFEFRGMFDGVKSFFGTDIAAKHNTILDTIADGFQNRTVGDFISQNEFDQFSKLINTNEGGLTNKNGNAIGTARPYDTLSSLTVLELLKTYIGFSSIDKAFRTTGANRYSITFPGKVETFFQRRLTTNTSVERWINNIYTHWDTVKEAAEKDWKREGKTNTDANETMADSLFSLFVFDIAQIKLLREKSIISNANDIRNRFYKGALGDGKKKAKTLASIYKTADIVCVQETSQALVDEMTKRTGFLSLGSSDFVLASSFKPGGSAIFLRKSIFSNTQKLPLINSQLDAAEVVLVTATASNQKYLIASAHSDSKGKNSSDILQEIDTQTVKNRIIVGHDANTKKADNVSTYLEKAQQLGLAPAFDTDSKEPVTSFKTRTFVQTQITKAEKEDTKRSDYILTKGLQVGTNDMIKKPGPSDDNPSDHAILQIAFSK